MKEPSLNATSGRAEAPDCRLAALLASRLCHDLAGPTGTLMGTLELAAEDEGAAAEAMALASQAAAELGARLKLLRAAWGLAVSELGVSELRELAGGLNRRRLEVRLDGLTASSSFGPQAGQLALNVVMLAAECLPMGGVVALDGDPAGDVIARIDGPRASWPLGFAAGLANVELAWQAVRSADAAVRTLQGPLTTLMAHSAGLRLSLLIGPNTEAAPPLLLSLGG